MSQEVPQNKYSTMGYTLKLKQKPQIKYEDASNLIKTANAETFAQMVKQKKFGDRKGRYVFIVTQNGNTMRYAPAVWMGPPDPQVKVQDRGNDVNKKYWVGHTTLLNKDELALAMKDEYKVKYAGMIFTKDVIGTVSSWEANSGHFKPDADLDTKALFAKHWGLMDIKCGAQSSVSKQLQIREEFRQKQKRKKSISLDSNGAPNLFDGHQALFNMLYDDSSYSAKEHGHLIDGYGNRYYRYNDGVNYETAMVSALAVLIGMVFICCICAIVALISGAVGGYVGSRYTKGSIKNRKNNYIQALNDNEASEV